MKFIHDTKGYEMAMSLGAGSACACVGAPGAAVECACQRLASGFFSQHVSHTRTHSCLDGVRSSGCGSVAGEGKTSGVALFIFTDTVHGQSRKVENKLIQNCYNRKSRLFLLIFGLLIA